MSSIINKVKEAVAGDKSSSSTTHGHQEGTTTHGTHASHTANTTDPRVGSHGHTGTTTHAGHTSTTHPEGGHAALGGEPNRGFDGPASKTDGPHNSNMMNKADPRVDSDRDHSRNMGANPHGDATTTSRNTHGTTGTTGTGINTHGTTGMTGSGMNTHGTTGTTGSGLNTHGTTGMTGSGMTGSGMNTRSGGMTGTGNNIPEGTAGHHNSRAANAADPRIDSDLDSRHHTAGGHTSGGHTSGSHTTGAMGSAAVPGAGSHTTGTHGHHTTSTTGTTGTHGHHDTSAMGTTGTSGGLTGSHGTSGPGPAPNTAGPHKSDMLNKVDPRVDSDRDGSKTYGGDKTYDNGRGTAGRDPRDSTQVPPSVMQSHIGKPTIEHEDAGHDRERRHSVNHRENHHGL